jgi:hypothetical protein
MTPLRFPARVLFFPAMLVAAILCPAASAAVTVTTLDASARGWVAPFNVNTLGNVSYATGFSDGQEYRTWFAFDLSGLANSSQIYSATLNLLVPPGGYLSAQPGETFALFDVSTPKATLATAAPGQAAFADLGAGVSYGQAEVTASDVGTTIQVALNAAGLAALNGAKGGEFLIGGAVTSIIPGSGDEVVFSNSAFTPLSATTLSVVPEAASPSFLTLASGMILLRRRRKLAREG